MTAAYCRAARGQLGLNKSRFADLLRVERNAPGRWEAGRQQPHQQTVLLIRAILLLHRLGRLDEWRAG